MQRLSLAAPRSRRGGVIQGTVALNFYVLPARFANRPYLFYYVQGLRFIGFTIQLFGTHYAGFKQPQVLKRYCQYENFAYWYREYLAMVWVDYPDLRKIKRLARLAEESATRKTDAQRNTIRASERSTL